MTIKTQASITAKRARVCKLAYDLCQNKGYSSADAMKTAWALIKANPTAQVITFLKKDNTITSRLVEPWFKHYQVRGTGRPTKPGQKLFADMHKIALGKNGTISLYKESLRAIV